MKKQSINITDEDDKREISQLWFIALYYFERAKEIKNNVNNKYLQETIEKITRIYKEQSNPNCKEEIIPQDICKKIMLLNAHLASCAVRLCTIDEILGQIYNSSGRWSSYANLQGQLKEFENRINNSAHKTISISVHRLLLKHHFGHCEPNLSLGNKSFSTSEEVLRTFIGDLYGNIGKDIKIIVNRIKNNADKTMHFLLRHNIAHPEPDFSIENKKYQIIAEVVQRFRIEELYTKLDTVKKTIEKDISSIVQKYSRGKIDFNCC